MRLMRDDDLSSAPRAPERVAGQKDDYGPDLGGHDVQANVEVERVVGIQERPPADAALNRQLEVAGLRGGVHLVVGDEAVVRQTAAEVCVQRDDIGDANQQHQEDQQERGHRPNSGCGRAWIGVLADLRAEQHHDEADRQASVGQVRDADPPWLDVLLQGEATQNKTSNQYDLHRPVVPHHHWHQAYDQAPHRHHTAVKIRAWLILQEYETEHAKPPAGVRVRATYESRVKDAGVNHGRPKRQCHTHKGDDAYNHHADVRAVRITDHVGATDHGELAIWMPIANEWQNAR
mmetsp:Transcript_63587/g.194478  ORF Transcript_63587/g.194478 Transcript_63587/m.194478 type:complete len:290 (-) Transcript_63587:286-1155(-)